MESFNLSHKIIANCWCEDPKNPKAPDELYEDEVISIKDVKDFIRLLKQELSFDLITEKAVRFCSEYCYLDYRLKGGKTWQRKNQERKQRISDTGGADTFPS